MSTQDVNPYLAPKSELEMSNPATPGGSLEDAIAGRYDFRIGEVMGQAWDLTKGFKASFWGAAILIYLAVIVVMMVVGAIVGFVSGGKPNVVVSMIVNGVASGLMAPLTLGIIMMGVRRAAGVPVRFSTAFGFFNRAGTVIAATLLSLLLIYIGVALLVIPGIYLGTAYVMTTPLVGDRELSAWRAMETSRKAITHRWFRVFGLLMLVGLIVAVSALPLGIPLIWTAPWATLVLGVLYRRIFGGGTGAAARPAA